MLGCYILVGFSKICLLRNIKIFLMEYKCLSFLKFYLGDIRGY